MTVKELQRKLERLHAPNAQLIFTTPGPTPDVLLMFNPTAGADIKYQSGIAWIGLKSRKVK